MNPHDTPTTTGGLAEKIGQHRLRSWPVLLCLPLLLLAVAVLFYVSMPTQTLLIEQGLYDKIRLGMTEEEVDAAIPYSPGDHVGAFAYETEEPLREGDLPIVTWETRPDGTLTGIYRVTGKPVRGKWWLGTKGYLVVFFGEDNRIIERRYYTGHPESAIEHVRRKLPW